MGRKRAAKLNILLRTAIARLAAHGCLRATQCICAIINGLDAVILGKTNTAEFGQSATCANLLGIVTRNPGSTDCTPGGSSGGAAVSIAAGYYAPLALGADGGGLYEFRRL